MSCFGPSGDTGLCRIPGPWMYTCGNCGVSSKPIPKFLASSGPSEESGISSSEDPRVSSSLQLELPSFAEGRLHPLVGVAVVCDFALGVVPDELAFIVSGHSAEHQPLGVRPADAEVGAGRRTTLAGAHPIARMRGTVVACAGARRPLEIRIWQLVLRPSRSRKQAHAFTASARAQIALRADEDEVVSARLRLAA